jgi:RNA polymerase sigma-70 factor (ECF subfamily)
MPAESNPALASCPAAARAPGLGSAASASAASASAAETVSERPSTRELFKAHAGFVLRLVRHLGVGASDAEDVTQEVFMIAHGRLALLRSDASPRNWLFGIARRLAANHVRKSKRRRDVPLEDRDAVEQGTPATELQLTRDRTLLLQALDQLDAAKREVFVLFELESLAMQEVADMLGCPLHTAYSRLYAARSIVQRRVLSRVAHAANVPRSER